MANRLKDETSPYLLQHAHNPVDWYPWAEEALSKAKAENKLILVSIGYSACHWCHVMERESFEDQEVAQLMNKYFVCIKIDRESRPDIDQIYMTAVQLMTGSGGWPLNCFCLPDQRPIYGGTYFGKKDWMNLLNSLAAFWATKPEEAEGYAERLTEGIRQSDQLVALKNNEDFSKKDLIEIFEAWKRSFDLSEGGYNRVPKFPLPNNWHFMLRYACLMNDNAAHVAANITLRKMAFGGIFDQIGGGFARYSVDGRWHIPHFEKMLYDNAQMVSLYSEAFQFSKNQIYKDVVYQTLDFVSRELSSPEGGFYSALDADSEGVEGKFYTFTKKELDEILGDEAELFNHYYHVTEQGNWEEEHTNVLYRADDSGQLDSGHTTEDVISRIRSAREKVFMARSTRVRPALDNKILASWNGMMIKAYTDAYRVFDEKDFLDTAIKAGSFILTQLFKDGLLMRVHDDSRPSPAFLDDYAFVIDAFIGLYESTFDEAWLLKARELGEYMLTDFYDDDNGLFYYTSGSGEQLIARQQEILDNVIPSSNSVMANNLFKLGHLFDMPSYLEISGQMLKNVFPHIKKYPSGYSNWASLLLNMISGVYELAITGPEAEQKRAELEKYYIPNKILLGGTSGTLPLLTDKWYEDTRIFVCQNKTCSLPVTEITEAVKQINNPGTVSEGHK